jgi:hypothetical protein
LAGTAHHGSLTISTFSGGVSNAGTLSAGFDGILVGGSGTTFTNVNNTIAGAGIISGLGTFINSGTVEADVGSQPLSISTGATGANAGTMKAISSGDLFIETNWINSATIETLAGGFVEIFSTVSNTTKGVMLASGNGLVQIFNTTVSGGKVEALSSGLWS